MGETRSHPTPYGFQYGAAHVVRTCSHKGYVVLMIQTPRQWLRIDVTPTGLIRVGELTKAPKEGP